MALGTQPIASVGRWSWSPGHRARGPLGIEIAVFGLLVGRTLMALGRGDMEGEPRALVFVDRLSPRGLIPSR
jgi:hypothetical protein